MFWVGVPAAKIDEGTEAVSVFMESLVAGGSFGGFADGAHFKVFDPISWMGVVDDTGFVVIEVHTEVMATILGDDAGLTVNDDAAADVGGDIVVIANVLAVHGKGGDAKKLKS